MATTGTSTVRDIVTDALLDIEAGTLGQAPSAAEMDAGVRNLNRMLKAWQMEGSPKFLTSSQTVTLTTSASYTLNPVRPVRVISARLKQNGIETPMFEMTRDEYDELPQKESTGLPTQFYYDRQRESALFYVWPVLASASGQTIEITYEREIEDVTDPDDTIDLPVEWYDAAVLGLAARLSNMFGSADRKALIKQEARMAFNSAMGGDLEGSFYWRGKYD